MNYLLGHFVNAKLMHVTKHLSVLDNTNKKTIIKEMRDSEVSRVG